MYLHEISKLLMYICKAHSAPISAEKSGGFLKLRGKHSNAGSHGSSISYPISSRANVNRGFFF